MNEELWAGADLKIEYALCYLGDMQSALEPPGRNHYEVAQMANGSIVDTGWQRKFYAYFDAFLSAVRSVPDIIKCTFGVDKNAAVAQWLRSLSQEENTRRTRFQQDFKPLQEAFAQHLLSRARIISMHRSGIPNVSVKVIGMLGRRYEGGPSAPIPLSESRESTAIPNFPWRPIQIHPTWQDFWIEDKPLFASCANYLDEARALRQHAQALAASIHGNRAITPPPEH